MHYAKNVAMRRCMMQSVDARGQPTLLIVDDDADSRMLLAELMRADCAILLAQDGRTALQRAVDTSGISLILLDVTMPEIGRAHV